MTTSVVNYGSLSIGGLSVSNITVSEVDVGNFISFNGSGPVVFGISSGAYAGVDFAAFDSTVTGAGSSESLTFTFNVSAATGNVISAMSALYLVDQFAGTGTSLTATESAYDTSGNLLGTQSFIYGQTAAGPVTLATAQQTVNVTLTLTESISAAGSATPVIDMSGLQALFAQTAAPVNTASIGDQVFLDLTGSGLESGFNAGPGFPGVTVELLDGTGTSVLATTTTDSLGQYSFSSLAAGTYEVAFIAPTGYTFSPQGVGGSADAGIDSSPNATTGITGPITLTAGQVDNNVEAGLVPPGSAQQGSATLGDYVWFDANGNGLIDSGETGVGGVTVDLLNAAGTSVLSTTTTTSSGYYSFTNLTAGTYAVQFVAPSGDGFTTQGVGTNPALDSSANATTGITAPVTLTAGQVDNNVEAGLMANASVAIDKQISTNGTTWLDVGTGTASLTGTNDPSVLVGTPLYERVIVSNTGSTALSGLTVNDAGGNGPASFAVGSTLAAGTSEISAVATITAASGYEEDTATVTGTGTDSLGNTATATASDQANYTGESPAIGVAKYVSVNGGATFVAAPTTSGDPTEIATGPAPEYEFVVTNSGNVALTNVTLRDSVASGGAVNLGSLGAIGSLAAGASATIIAVGNWAAGQNTDTGSVVGTVIANGVTATPTAAATANYYGATPGIDIEKLIEINNNGTWYYTQDSNNIAVNVTQIAALLGVSNLANIVNGAPNLSLATTSTTSVPVDYAVVVTNTSTGGLAESNIVVNDATLSGTGTLPAFTFGTSAATITALAAGQSAISNIVGETVAVVGATAGGTVINSLFGDTATVKGTATDSVGHTGTVTDSASASYSITNTGGSVVTPAPAISIVKTVTSVGGVAGDPAATYAGEVIDYKIVVTNTGNETLTNVVVKDTTLGTTLGTLASLAPGAVVIYAASQTVTQVEINQAACDQGCNPAPTSSAQSCSVSGQGLSSGCTAWLNSSFTPTSCANGASYSFQTISCTIKGPNCGTITQTVPNATVTFSSSCIQATTVYNAAQNCWVTTLPAGCNPGNVFLSGLPTQVPSGCNLSGATLTWTIGQSVNNCGAAGVSWQTGCSGYNNFAQNGCNGLNDYNQIGVQACDNAQVCGSANQGWGNQGNGNGCAGTPVNQYTANNCGSGGYGGYGGCGGNNGDGNNGGGNNGGTCGNGSGSGTIACNVVVTNTATVSDGQTPTQSSTASTQVIVPTGVIGDYVWFDSNGSGLINSGETGVAGVTVDLLNASGTSALAVTTTNSSGYYSFTNLAAGSYEVKFVAPAGDAFTIQGVGTNPALDSSANATTGITAPLTLTAGQTDNNVEAGLKGTASLGDYVWFDTNNSGLINSGETGVAGVTVDLLNSAGAVLAATTTNSSGFYSFTGLAAGSYEVKFVAPTGDAFTTQGVGTNPALDSSANATTGITAPISLTAGQIDNNVEAGLIKAAPPSLSVLKLPCAVVVNECGQVTYSFKVTNTGTTPLSNVVIKDNIGTAASPDYVTPTLQTTGTNGVLAPGATWVYTETVNQIGDASRCAGSVTHTASGSNLGAGCSAWLSSTFNPTSCANGATYVFQGITCTISGRGVGSAPITETCPNAVITFSSSCSQATTSYDNSTNCWVTTLPANANPGSVFLSGMPLTVPQGCNLSGCNVTWSIGDSSNNCGAASITWDQTCTGFSSFNQNGCNGSADYNQIGVKVCDNSGGYGNGGSCNQGYGWNGSGYCGSGGQNGGWGGNSYGWTGSSSDCAGTPENQYTSSNCGSRSFGQGNGGGGGSGSCASTGSLNIAGVADTVTVTATGPTGVSATASDIKEVQVLGANSNITVNGSAPTTSLSNLYGAAQTLEFSYVPGNTVSTQTISAGLASVSGTNSAGMAFVEISNNANPYAAGASVYFAGSVTSGEDIFADATTNVLTNTPVVGGHFSTTAGADIYACVFASQAAFAAGVAPLQTIAYNTSGSQSMHLGDVIGSLTVVGYVGSSGGHLVS